MSVRIETQAEPIPGYRLIERLGCGGFGEVWKAEAPGGLLKAIKFVYGDLESVDASGGARAMQEMKALDRVKAVRHPYILNLERYDIIDGQLLIVMELADRSLWDRYRDCRNSGQPGIPRSELLGYLQEAAEALDFMNEKYNLQHLDIKPQNLFLVFNHVKVADFGLVKMLEGTQASVTGGVTPVYAAPETLLDGQVTRYSDQYSLAIVYQELLTSQRPYTGANTRQLIMQRMEGQPNLSSLPAAEQPIVARAMSKRPADRFPSCYEFIRALQETGPGRRTSASQLEDTPCAPPLTPLGPIGSPTPPLISPKPGVSTDVVPLKFLGVTPPPATSRTMTSADVAEEMAGPEEPLAGEAQQRQEQSGEGVLYPSLVIGLGRYGRSVLQQLRQQIQERHGKVGDLAHLRLLAIDTDPEAASHAASKGLASDEILVTRINRPGHYLKPRNNLPPIDDWLNAQMLYRIPRSLTTSGVRAFGRLAFIEHARNIGARVRRDLEQITHPEALTLAAQQTGLVPRTNWPRVYLIAHLAGGTGSGMFLDLAYLVRSQLRELGYERPDVVGVFVLPAVGDPEWTDLAIANGHAALLELHHYLTPGQRYKARLEERGKLVEDAEPPFTRCYLLPTPEGDEAPARDELGRAVGDLFYRKLFTPLVRAAEAARGELTLPTTRSSVLASVGLHVLATSRRPLIRRTAGRLCQDLLGQWTVKSLPELASGIQQEVNDLVKRQRLDPQSLMEQLQQACTRELSEAVPGTIARWVIPVQQMLPAGYPDPRTVRDALQQAELLLGSPDEKNTLRPSPVTVIVRAAMDHLVKETSPRLINSLLRYLDLPGYRVSGAEEAIRQASAVVEGWLRHFEQQIEQATEGMRGLLERLLPELIEWERLVKAGSRTRRTPSAPPAEIISRAATLRYEQILLQGLTAVYLSLRGKLTDQIKDLRFCRTRLGDIQKMFGQDKTSANEALPPTHEILLPAGCQTLAEAAKRTSEGITPEQFAALDQAIQKALKKQFQPLGQLCLLPGEWPRQLQALLLQEAEKFLTKLLPPQDAAELLLQSSPSPQELADDLTSAFEEARPGLAEPQEAFQREIALLFHPDSEAGRLVAQAANEARLAVRPQPSPNGEELVFYREHVGLTFGELKQLSSTSREAYDRACTIEHFTPHSRMDVKKWKGME